MKKPWLDWCWSNTGFRSIDGFGPAGLRPVGWSAWVEGLVRWWDAWWRAALVGRGWGTSSAEHDGPDQSPQENSEEGTENVPRGCAHTERLPRLRIRREQVELWLIGSLPCVYALNAMKEKDRI